MGGNVHLGAGLGIAASAAAALAGAETTETADFDFVVGLQRGDDAFEDRLDHRFRFLAGQFGHAGDLFDEVRFRIGMFFCALPQLRP